MVGESRIRRRDVLKTTGGLLGGFAIAGAVATPAAAQPTSFRYDRVRVQLVDVERVPPRSLSVESPLYLTQALLSECDTGHPCSIQILDYQRTDDGDDDDDQGDDADDTGVGDDQDDDDGDDGGEACPGFASVVLLCHAGSASDAVVMTGLIRDVLTRYEDQGVDFAVSLTPSTATNVDTPRRVSNPCSGDGSEGDDGGRDDDGDDGGDGNGDDDDDGGPDDGGDDGNDDDGNTDGGGDDDN